MALEIKNLEVSIDGKKILKGINLTINKGEVHAVMGLNGSGKSTLSYALVGHPSYTVDAGTMILDGKEINDLKPDERARNGLFLSFQYPSEIPGVTLANFLRTALNARKEKPIPILEFKKLLDEKMALLKMDKEFARRYLNVGFSGGEKKRAEILQMALLNPSYAILDETDSGLDIDALKVVAEGIKSVYNKNMGILLITHYQRILNYIQPDKVHVMHKGRIIKEGGKELAHKLEAEGYDNIIKEYEQKHPQEE